MDCMYFSLMGQKKEKISLVSLIDIKQSSYEIYHLEPKPLLDAFVEKAGFSQALLEFWVRGSIFSYLTCLLPSSSLSASNPNQLRDCGRPAIGIFYAVKHRAQ